MPVVELLRLLVLGVVLSPGTATNVPLYSCDFEDGCYLSNDMVAGSREWKRGSGETSMTGDTGPQGDHTTTDGSGAYWFMDASGAGNGDKAIALTPWVTGTGQVCSTVSFYYHMYGADIGALNVYLLMSPYVYDNPVWSLEGNQGNQWQLGEFNVSFPINFRVAFEGVAKRGIFDNNGDIALDDITVVTGLCDYTTCDSSTSWCQNGGTCVVDESNSTTSYVCECMPGWHGVHCESDVDECASNPCINGSCTHALNSYQCVCDIGFYGDNCQFADMCISPEVHRCQNGGTCLPWGDDFNCTCTAGFTGKTCDVDIDDCANQPCLHGGVCTDRVNGYVCQCSGEWLGHSCEYLAGGCNFDTGMGECNYTTTPPGDYLWYEHIGRSPNFDTGPRGDDHTIGEGGTYMLADGLSEVIGSVALLYTPTFPVATVGKCSILRFWYYMYGNTVGTLNVFATGTGVPTIEGYPIWTLSGEQGEGWFEATVDISSPAPYSIIFEASVGNYLAYRGDIAIDDVTVTPDACAYKHCFSNPCLHGGTCLDEPIADLEYTCLCTDQWDGPICDQDVDQCLSNPCQNGGTCIDGHQSYTCTCPGEFVGRYCEYFKGSCDFEDVDDRICSYVNDVTGDFDWLPWTAGTPSVATGPDGDHTTTNGYYLYAEASYRVAGDRGKITSPEILGSANTCTEVSFWYYMYGASVGQLGLYLDIGEDDVGNPVWSAEGRSRREWNYVLLNISMPQNFRIAFEVIMNSKSLIDDDNRGDIAIDDIEVRPTGNCDYEVCFSKPCQHNGTCVAEGQFQFRCICHDHYSGENCEIYEQCQPNPCWNQGLCEIGGDGNFECLCPEGWMGPTCSLVDRCAPSPCSNGATCTTVNDHYVCQCVEGYEGATCNVDTDDCASSPCLNGGSCTDKLAGFTCVCTEPFYGDNCEQMPSSCDFEDNSFCGWSVDGKSEKNWMLYTGLGPLYPLSGPRTDHTLGTAAGSYILTPVSLDVPADGTLYRLRSDTFAVEQFGYDFRVEFYYHMTGAGLGSLSVYTQEVGSAEVVLYKTSEDKGNSWVLFEDNVTVSNDWSLILEHKTIKTALNFGDIAVDDIKISIREIEIATTTTAGSTTQPTTTPKVDHSTTATSTPHSTTEQDTSTTLSTTTVTTTTGEKTTTTTGGVTTSTTTTTTTTQTLSTTSNVDATGGKSGGANAGVIAGAVIGTLVGLALIAGLAFYLLAKRNPKDEKKLFAYKEFGSGLDPGESNL